MALRESTSIDMSALEEETGAKLKMVEMLEKSRAEMMEQLAKEEALLRTNMKEEISREREQSIQKLKDEEEKMKDEILKWKTATLELLDADILEKRAKAMEQLEKEQAEVIEKVKKEMSESREKTKALLKREETQLVEKLQKEIEEANESVSDDSQPDTSRGSQLGRPPLRKKPKYRERKVTIERDGMSMVNYFTCFSSALFVGAPAYYKCNHPVPMTIVTAVGCVLFLSQILRFAINYDKTVKKIALSRKLPRAPLRYRSYIGFGLVLVTTLFVAIMYGTITYPCDHPATPACAHAPAPSN